MTENFKTKGEGVYKAEALLPPMPKKDRGGGYGDSGLPPQDWNEDPLLKEKPRTPDMVADEKKRSGR